MGAATISQAAREAAASDRDHDHEALGDDTHGDGERAMLETFAGWLQPETILVSYNGKSYDAPLLKGRFRLNRVGHRLADLPHIDWLHPTRRVYKGHLPNCKLATIEREVLRIVREDDLPGSEAPAAWLAFLRGHSSTNLARVLDHNRQDVITLMRLGDHNKTYAEIVRLRFLENWTVEKVAAELGISESTVKRRYARAMGVLGMWANAE